ncbi:MAG: aryl-sulfate sulfotransferase [Lachnospiraceae bacterium]|nr:aryl-sulfate sulfotransferase [Lachnospiraceae bacterium]
MIVNPYKNSPLTAVVIFTTDEETGVEVVVCGKDGKNNITASFESDKTHILPIYGLYAGDTTEVVLTLDDGTSTTLAITTEPLNEATAAGPESADSSTHSEASNTSGDGTDATLVIETEAPDATLTGAEVTVYEDAADGVLSENELTFAFVQSAQEGVSGAVAYDNAGEIRWFMEADTIRAYPMTRLANRRMMALTADVIGGEDSSSGLVEFDLCGKFYAIYLVPGGVHHDFVEMENGNLLVCSNSEDFSTLADRVVEIDRETGEVVYELIVAEPLETEDGATVRVIDEDWYHINSIDYDEASDTLLISCPNHNAVLAGDKTEKVLLWMLIDPTGLFTTVEGLFFTVAEGEEDFEWPHAQTNVSFLPDGDILVFDNGAQQTESATATGTEAGADIGNESAEDAGSGIYSLAVRYHLDTENMTISLVWSYGAERGEAWDSSDLSGAVYLAEDTYLITSGSCMDSSGAADDAGAEAAAETEAAAVAEDSSADSAEEEILCTYIDVVVGDELVYELNIPASTYRSMRETLYTEDNTYSVSDKGVWYGSLGTVATADASELTATVDGTTSTLAAIAKTGDSAKKTMTSRMADASKEINFTLAELVNMPDRLQVSGSWYRTGEDASLVLISESGDVYRFAIEADNPESESEAADFVLWITDESVPAGHRYYIYLYNRGVLYKTHRYWTVS